MAAYKMGLSTIYGTMKHKKKKKTCKNLGQ